MCYFFLLDLSDLQVKKNRDFDVKGSFLQRKKAFGRRVGIKLFRYLSANSTLPGLFWGTFSNFITFGQKIISILLPTLRHFTLQPLEWLVSNFSLQYRPWIKHEGHENKGKDHQLKKLLIVWQNLLVSTFGNVYRTVWRKCILMLGFKKVKSSISTLCCREASPGIITAVSCLMAGMFTN